MCKSVQFKLACLGTKFVDILNNKVGFERSCVSVAEIFEYKVRTFECPCDVHKCSVRARLQSLKSYVRMCLKCFISKFMLKNV